MGASLYLVKTFSVTFSSVVKMYAKLLLVFCLIENHEALSCYFCDWNAELPNGTCFNFTMPPPSVDCSTLSYPSFVITPNEIGLSTTAVLPKNEATSLRALSGTEYECVVIEVQYNSLDRHILRSCNVKSKYNDVCTMLGGRGDAKVTQCRFCDGDYCNSAQTLKAAVYLYLIGLISFWKIL